MESNSCDKKMKHLEMIEGIIERMGSNSFQLKGWAVTLVSVIGALSAQGSDKRFFLLSFIPLIACIRMSPIKQRIQLISIWILEAFYVSVMMQNG